MKKTKVTFDNDKLEYSSELLRALAHPLRLKILEFIDKHQEINVNKIYNTLNIEQSITSQHLKVLRMAGIVDTDRDGKFVHYSIDYARLIKTVKALTNFYNAEKVAS
ncbi:MAG: helix-turn-helix transcriptional regulator [Saprospiraceae bacterium]|jgi:DNA-binding transcriptional ArsR family regulator|nr:helix-turn-helix transcriptional regulator [Saprospiraceae bacterium]